MTKEPALVFRDKHDPDVVRVEWFDTDGGCELTLFSGPRAAERAVSFAKFYYIRFHLADDLKAKE
jgi:hypothetical protein